MGEHLAKKLTCFPQAQTRQVPVRNVYRKEIREELFCTCRMPNDRTMPMICCDQCGVWLHKTCMDLDLKKSYANEHWE